VKKGDSIETLADRMAFERYRTERFCVLNGLKKNAKLVAGQRVKIVTE
jgi:predicted Zn-dependent protease